MYHHLERNHKKRTVTRYYKYRVNITDIEWDVGKDPVADGYDLNYIANLPQTGVYELKAPDDEAAKDWALEEFSENHGFLILACKTKIERLE